MQSSCRSRRTVAAVLLVLYLPTCHHYVTPKGTTPTSYIATAQPEEVQVVLRDSSRLILLAPSVAGDTIVGQIAGGTRPIRLAVADVSRIGIRRFDVGGTLGVVFAVAVVMTPVAFLIYLSQLEIM